jgi:hypothetical protein
LHYLRHRRDRDDTAKIDFEDFSFLLLWIAAQFFQGEAASGVPVRQLVLLVKKLKQNFRALHFDGLEKHWNAHA